MMSVAESESKDNTEQYEKNGKTGGREARTNQRRSQANTSKVQYASTASRRRRLRLLKGLADMEKPLFDYLLGKKKSGTITELEEKILKLYLQIYLLNQYFSIAANYCKTEKIQEELEELYPAWTGYENYYWYTYHYEAFGNALYSYSQMYKSILNLLSRNITNFPEDGSVLLEKFLANKAINKILQDRHDSVHQFGKWRSELSEELALQNWQSAEKKIRVPFVEADRMIKIFDQNIINFINIQLQSHS